MNLKEILDHFYRDYDFAGRLSHDPIKFPHRYSDPRDIEIVAFISSCLAYGKVELFMPVIEQILKKMGKSPYEFSINLKPRRGHNEFEGINYRLNSSDDILCLIYVLGVILREYDSLESLFIHHDREDEINIFSGLNGFVGTILGIDTSPVYGTNLRPRGYLHFLPLPQKGSACKRMNLFLRWMVRDRDIDFGLWKNISKDRLVIPLDTHIARISRCLGFTNRKSQDWRMAVEITESLKRLDPIDPLKYDFALCHHGISKACKRNSCRDCKFYLTNFFK